MIGLTVLVKTSPYIAFDDAILRAIQSLDLGPLTAVGVTYSSAGRLLRVGSLDRPSLRESDLPSVA